MIGIPFMSIWSPFTWKLVNYRFGAQWPVPTSLGILLPRRCLKQKKFFFKKKVCFFSRKKKSPLIATDYIYHAQQSLEAGLHSLKCMQLFTQFTATTGKYPEAWCFLSFIYKGMVFFVSLPLCFALPWFLPL